MRRGRLVAALFALGAEAAAAATSVGCLIEPERVAEIGSPVVGVLESIGVDRGDSVAAGQVLAVLRGDVERANLQVAETRSRLDADVAASAAKLQLAQQRRTRYEELYAAKFISKQGLDEVVAEAEVAAQKLAQAKEQIKVWNKELGVAQAQVGQRTVRSPFGGVVVERYSNPGERVEDKPILKVALIDPLRVEVLLPASYYNSIGVGSMLTIIPELPNATAVPAKVTRVDKVLDAASNTFRVRLMLPNPANKLPAGLRCKVDMGEGKEVKAPASAAGAKSERPLTITPVASRPKSR